MPRSQTKRPTLATIAKAMGVSVATVSYSFSRPEKVSERVRGQVLAEAQRQGYAGPDPVARQLSRGRTDTVGLLFTEKLSYAFADPAAIAFIQGLTISCQSAGLNLLLVSTDTSGTRPSAVDNAIVDGFVVYSVPADDPHLLRIIDRNLPTVIVDSPSRVADADWVGPDDYAGGKAVGSFVSNLGHQNIGIITAARGYSGPVDIDALRKSSPSIEQARILGFVDALEQSGSSQVAIDQRVANTEAHGAAALHALLDRNPDITAVCATTDILALGALAAAHQLGLNVPNDLTVTGFDDIPDAGPAGLTTVSQPLVDKGRLAGDLYLSQRPGMAPRHRTLELSLQVRQTSAPPRQHSGSRP